MKTSHIVAATVGTVAVAAVGYALYFDSKRRSDPEFRRKLSTIRFFWKLVVVLILAIFREAVFFYLLVLCLCTRLALACLQTHETRSIRTWTIMNNLTLLCRIPEQCCFLPLTAGLPFFEQRRSANVPRSSRRRRSKRRLPRPPPLSKRFWPASRMRTSPPLWRPARSSAWSNFLPARPCSPVVKIGCIANMAKADL